MSERFRIDFLNGGTRVKTVDLQGEPLEAAIEIAGVGMRDYKATLARIVDKDGVEVWNGRNDTKP